jgi:hypothetical protein
VSSDKISLHVQCGEKVSSIVDANRMFRAEKPIRTLGGRARSSGFAFTTRSRGGIQNAPIDYTVCQ